MSRVTYPIPRAGRQARWSSRLVGSPAVTPVTAAFTGTTDGTSTATGQFSSGVTYLATGASVTAASGDITANYPAVNITTDDILVLDVSARDNVTITLPAGWTKKAEANNGIGLRQTIGYRRRVGGDVETSVAVTHTGGAQIAGRVHLIRGAFTTGDPFEAATGPTSVTAGATGTFPSVTTVTDGDLLFYAFAYEEDYTVAPSITNAQSLTLTERDLAQV